ncbi:MAG TPA: hypothetical protein VIY72_16685 [Acidimicrobiales bacterium]
MRVRGLLVACAIGGAVVLGGAAPASAGGSWFDPVQDSYQPGDEVTLVGFTGGGSQGWVEDGPFHGFLVAGSELAGGLPGPDGFRLELGQLTLQETGHGGYLFLRASITFTLPADLAPGVYTFDYCNTGCVEKLGDLIGATVHVGVAPAHPIVRSWPFDEPEIANLDPAAELSGPDGSTTAGQVQAGRVGAGPISTPPPTSAPTSTTTTSTTTASGEDELADGAVLVGLATTDDGASAVPWFLAATALVVAGAAGLTALVRRSQERERL